MIDLFAPSLAGDTRLRRAWSRYERQAASPGSTVAIVRLIYESDLRATLPAIQVPTLVIHRTQATGFRVEHGRYLAEPHRRVPSSSSSPASTTSSGPATRTPSWREIQTFLTGVRPVPEPDRVLATVLFTDIVGSTRPGGAAGRRAAGRRCSTEHHRDRATACSSGSAGREVKTTGDGFLATFDGPARADPLRDRPPR